MPPTRVLVRENPLRPLPMNEVELRQPLAQLIAHKTGLGLSAAALSNLDGLCRQRMALLGLNDGQKYIDWILSQGSADDELLLLVSQVTNGETYFYRDKPQCSAIQQILFELQGKTHRPVRAWSAGCSSGEEAFTLAILAAEEGIDIQILGTDLNSEALAAARTASYSQWVLRHLPPGIQERYFVPEAAGFRARDELRSRVRFEQRNLLDAPASPLGPLSWDIILCRNLFIYFDRGTVGRIARQLVGALRANGWLFLAPAETLSPAEIGVRAEMIPGTVGYRRRTG